MASESIENFVDLIAKVKGQHGEVTKRLDDEENNVPESAICHNFQIVCSSENLWRILSQ